MKARLKVNGVMLKEIEVANDLKQWLPRCLTFMHVSLLIDGWAGLLQQRV